MVTMVHISLEHLGTLQEHIECLMEEGVQIEVSNVLIQYKVGLITSTLKNLKDSYDQLSKNMVILFHGQI